MQPKGCYSIQIAFTDYQKAKNVTSRYALVIMALASLSLIVFTGRYYLKKGKEETNGTLTDGILIGKYTFSLSSQLLTFNSEIIELSGKEAKLLSILANQQNQLISREELLKRVWEEDGVITGRSLDMFISKLRKKLKNDSSVQITNVHGKGYKLEMTSSTSLL